MEDTNVNLFLAMPRKILILAHSWLWFQNSPISKIFMIFLVSTQFIFLACDIVMIVQSWGDLDAVSESPYICTQVSVCVKTTIFLNSQKSLEHLLDTMNSEVKSVPVFMENKNMRDEIIKRNNDIIIDCIRQQAVVGFIKDVENAFHFHIFFQIMGTVGLICITGFRATITEIKSVQFFAMISLMLTVVMQLYLFCWAGNGITSRSEKVRDCLYLSPWHAQDLKYQRIMVIAMECMKRNIVIKAGHIVPLCWPTFVSILRTSYSYFAVLSGT